MQPSWFQACHRTLSKKVISNSGFSLIDFCQKNCNSMGMAHPLADHVFFISTNQMQPRCQSCVEFNGEFRGWPSFLLILNPLQAVVKSKCGKLLFSILNYKHMARTHLLWPATSRAPCDSGPENPTNQLPTLRPFNQHVKIFSQMILRCKGPKHHRALDPPDHGCSQQQQQHSMQGVGFA